jgi:hypothetical protein
VLNREPLIDFDPRRRAPPLTGVPVAACFSTAACRRPRQFDLHPMV